MIMLLRVKLRDGTIHWKMDVCIVQAPALHRRIELYTSAESMCWVMAWLYLGYQTTLTTLSSIRSRLLVTTQDKQSNLSTLVLELHKVAEYRNIILHHLTVVLRCAHESRLAIIQSLSPTCNKGDHLHYHASSNGTVPHDWIEARPLLAGSTVTLPATPELECVSIHKHLRQIWIIASFPNGKPHLL